MKGFFVTGTDTEIGKTYSTCLLIKHLCEIGHNVAGLKPIASGCRVSSTGILENEDALQLIQHSNIKLPYSVVNRYAFEPAIAPHIAAANAGRNISIQEIHGDVESVRKLTDFVFIEAVGGWKVPINEDNTVQDLAIALGLPVILVVGIKLGCINHALLTIESMKRSGVPIAGWIGNLCNPETEVASDIIDTLKKQIVMPLIATIDYDQKTLAPELEYWGTP